jgi:hypothetical protein
MSCLCRKVAFRPAREGERENIMSLSDLFFAFLCAVAVLAILGIYILVVKISLWDSGSRGCLSNGDGSLMGEGKGEVKWDSPERRCRVLAAASGKGKSGGGRWT